MSSPAARPFTPMEERIGSVVIRYMSRLNAWLYRTTGGRWGGRWLHGEAIGLLTHRGRRSGRTYTSPLLFLEDGARLVVVASKGGMSMHPLWYLNLRANPDCEFQIGATVRRMRARTASPEEKRAYWPRVVALNGDFATYQARTTRDIPVVVLEPRDGSS